MDWCMTAYDLDASSSFKEKKFDKRWWAGSSVVYDGEIDIGYDIPIFRLLSTFFLEIRFW